MEGDRKAYDDWRAKEQPVEAKKRHLQVVAQQAVRAEHLTGNEHWDAYLSFLQAAIERMTIVRDSHRAILLDPQNVDQDAMMKAKIGLCEAEAMMLAWETAMSLPGDLIRDGEIAKERLDEIGSGE